MTHSIDTTKAPQQTKEKKAGASISTKADSAYDLISPVLTEKALKNIDVVRMIINERHKLLAENTELKEYRDNFFSSEREKVVLNEKLKTFNAFDVLSIGTITVGSLLAGSSLNPMNSTLFSIGILFIIVGVVAKVIKAK